MLQLFKDIFVLPPIVQGVIGSALFWLILKMGTYIVSKAKYNIEKLSSRARYVMESQEYLILKFRENRQLVLFSKGYFLCFNSAFNNIVTGLLWVLLGLLFASINKIFYAIGIVGGILYFIQALSWLPNVITDSEDKIKQRITDIEKSREKYEASKGIKPFIDVDKDSK